MHTGIAAVCSVCHWNDWSLLAQESKVLMQILLLRLWLLVKPILIEIVCQSWKCVKGYLWEEEGEQSVHAPCLLNHSIILPAGQRDCAANCPATSQVEHRDQICVIDIQVTWEALQSSSCWRSDLGSIVPQSSQVARGRCSSDLLSFLYSYFTITLLLLLHFCLFLDQHCRVSLGVCVVLSLCPDGRIDVLVWYCLFLSLQKWLHFDPGILIGVGY